MAKIHRSDAPLPQAPSVQVKASYTVTDLPKVSPQEPAAFYDQDNDEDYRRRETAKCKKKRGNLLYTLAMIVFAAIFLISGGLLVKRFLDDRKTESEFADLQSMIDTAATPAPAGENVNPNGARFAALRDKNSDFIGWISIDGTNLDFPVMYAPDNKDFYLRHDFNKAYSVYGVPYLDEQTTLGANAESDNLIIYGHNMKDGSMFADLAKYRSKDFWQSHKTVWFDTALGSCAYEIFAVIHTTVQADAADAFPFYRFVDAAAPEEFADYVSACKARALYDTGISAEYGDKLLTLSTCDNITDDGRLLVIAKRIL